MKIIEIRVDDCIPTPDNPRLRIDESSDKFLELLASVRAGGVREPVSARPHPSRKGKFDLRDGARRHRASQIAGRETIPAIVREMTDAEAMEATICSFLGREDLSPIEAGEATSKLLDAYNGDVRAVASRLGISAAEVARRGRITDLTIAWIDAIRVGDGTLADWTVAHLELIARYEAEEQDVILQQYRHQRFYIPSVDELEHELRVRERPLEKAGWALDEHGIGDAPACSECMKRTDVKVDLFGPAVGNVSGARCTDSDCYEAKCKAWLKIREKELKKEHKTLAKVSVKTFAQRGRILDKTQYKAAKKTSKSSVPALVVDGPKAGEVIHIVPTGEGKSKLKGPEKKPSKKAREEKAKAEERKAHADLYRDRCQRIIELIWERMPSQGSKLESNYDEPPSARVMLIFGVWNDCGCTPKDVVRELGKTEGIETATDLAHALWAGLFQSIREWLHLSQREIENDSDDIRTMLDALRIDYDAIVRQAEAEFPAPKPADSGPTKNDCGVYEPDQPGVEVIEYTLGPKSNRCTAEVHIADLGDEWIWATDAQFNDVGRCCPLTDESAFAPSRDEALRDALLEIKRYAQGVDKASCNPKYIVRAVKEIDKLLYELGERIGA